MINYIGPYNSTGYGIASMGYGFGLKYLKKDDFNFVCIGAPDTTNPESKKPFINSILSSINEVDWTKPSICFWHFHDMENQISSAKGLKVGMSTFEVDNFLPQEKKIIDSLDIVGTASNWGKNVIKTHFPNKEVFVAPHAFKYLPGDIPGKIASSSRSKLVEYWQEALAPIQLSNETFIVSSAGKWEDRKSHPELLDAVLEVGKDKPILLVGFWHNPFIKDGFAYHEFYKRTLYPTYNTAGLKVFTKDKATIVLMPYVGDRQQLHSALAKAHLFMSPSKGEGWDLPLFEMMSFGMPCAASIVTAHIDYCTNDNIIPIPHDGLVKAVDNKFFYGHANWYSFKQSSIRDAIYQGMSMSSQELISMGEKAADETAKFSWQQSAEKVLNYLK